MTNLLTAGYSVAQYDSYIIVAMNDRQRSYLPVEVIQRLLPDCKCISWYGKVKVFI